MGKHREILEWLKRSSLKNKYVHSLRHTNQPSNSKPKASIDIAKIADMVLLKDEQTANKLIASSTALKTPLRHLQNLWAEVDRRTADVDETILQMYAQQV